MESRNIYISGIALLVVVAGGVSWWTTKDTESEPSQMVDTPFEDNIISTEALNPIQVTETIMDNENTVDAVRNGAHRVTIQTNKGRIVIETYDADAPNTVANFVKLANEKFYDGVIFHRVIRGFMIQGGDPTGTGTGGPGYRFDDELNPATESYRNGYKRGVVAMANAGRNTNGSQFFIMHQDYPLPNNYTIFGHVVEGIEVVDAIANTQTLPGDRPAQEVVMEQVMVEKL